MSDSQPVTTGAPILRPAGIAEPSYESIRRRNTRMTGAVIATLGGLLLTGTVAYTWIAGILTGALGFRIAILVFSLLVLLGGPLILRRPRTAAGLVLFGAIGILVVWGIRWDSLPEILMLAGTGLAILGGLFAIADIAREEAPYAFYRHSVIVRVTHWINAVCILILLMSGLQIFNAHPGLYWGEASNFDDPLVRMFSQRNPEGVPEGRVYLFGTIYNTDGWFAASQVSASDERKWPRGFPYWMTIPSGVDLATGRVWHFFWAWIFVLNGLVYIVYSLIGRHFRRDLLPAADQWRGIGRTIVDHARLRFHHKGDRRYNIIQKLTYIGVLIVFPVLILAGLAMSPALNAAFPWLPEAFGGRQSARTVHFICAALITLFVIVHVLLVLISGVWTNLISMFTGRYSDRPSRETVA